MLKIRVKIFLRKCGFWNGWEVPREGLSGGLLLGWLQGQTLNNQYSSKNLLHADLLDLKGTPLSITFVYGQPDHTKRNEVRVELKHLQTKAGPNWLCIGDFNQVLSNEDRLSFTNNKIVGVKAF